MWTRNTVKFPVIVVVVYVASSLVNKDDYIYNFISPETGRQQE